MSSSIIKKETKFMYKHTPTDKWVVFDFFIFNEPYLFLADTYFPEAAYSARNVIEEDFDRSVLGTELLKEKNKEEFELVELEVQHHII
jgi:hypothetical protein